MSKKWTIEQETQFSAFVGDGVSVKDIAAQMGITIKSARYKANHLGITIKPSKKGSGWRELESEFRSMISAGLSSREIAGHLGTTRNAVVGKAHRLGLHIRAEEMEAQRAARAQRGAYKKTYVYKPRPNRRKAITWQERIMARQLDLEFAPVTTLEGVGKVAFLDLESWMCRWPSGDGADLMFCGEEQQAGSSYCRCHHAMAYRPAMTVSDREQARRHFHALRNMAKHFHLPVAA